MASPSGVSRTSSELRSVHSGRSPRPDGGALTRPSSGGRRHGGGSELAPWGLGPLGFPHMGSMFESMRRDMEAFDNLLARGPRGFFDRVLGEQSLTDPGASATRFAMPMDIVEKEDRVEVHTELPGVSKESVKIEVDEPHGDDPAVLTIRVEHEVREGETKDDAAAAAAGSAGTTPRWHQIERFERTSMRRSVALPAGVDVDGLSARLDSGVLTVSVPKLPPAADEGRKRRTVPIA